MPEEKGPEDIVSRLEALRKRVPEEKAPRAVPAARAPEEGDRRRRLYRIVGILVLLIVIGGGAFAAYMFMLKPIKETEVARALALEQAKKQKENAINDAFAGLPSEYALEKSSLLASVEQATSAEQVNAIDVSTAANRAWRAYTMDKAEKMGKITERMEMKVGKETYRGLSEIRQRISVLAYTDLKGATFREIKMIQVPMRLKREQAVISPGDIVNIGFKNGSTYAYLAKNAKIVAVIRAKASGSINLAESERKSDTGGGVEGMGTVSSLSIGATSATLAGQYEGSTGLKMRQTQTTYKVEISELQKAAAAGKIDEEYLLNSFGIKLNKIEEQMGLGDLDVELLVIAEVSDTEETELALRAVSTDDRKNLIITKVV